ncbi:hypothetical protein ACFQX7_40525 [Luedemannella flava]
MSGVTVGVVGEEVAGERRVALVPDGARRHAPPASPSSCSRARAWVAGSPTTRTRPPAP